MTQVVHDLGVQVWSALEFLREAIADFHGEGIADGGMVPSQFRVEVERVVIITVTAEDLIFAEKPFYFGRLILFPFGIGIHFPQVEREWTGWIAQPHRINNYLADLVKGFTLEVIIPVMVANHIMEPDFKRNLALAGCITIPAAILSQSSIDQPNS